MNIRYVILAKYAEFTPDSTLNMIGGDSDKIEVPGFPCRIPSVTAAVKIELTPDDCAREHEIVGTVVRPRTGEVLASSDIHQIPPFDVPAPNPSTTIELGLVIQVLDVEIPERGAYEFQVAVNGALQSKTRLRVGPYGTMQRAFLAEREGGR
jgi:hypothetical protein